jgi:hypothetical protein
MTVQASAAASALRLGRSVWIWPIAGAFVGAWPVWRSLFPETSGLAPAAGLQAAAAAGELLLCGSWVVRYRHRITGFQLPLLALGVALIVLVMAGSRDDAPVADLAALVICWLAVALLFAGAVLLDGQRAFAAARAGAVPQVRLLVRAHERIGYCLFGGALAAATLLGSPQAYLLAAIAAASPGAVLIWAALCDTARAVLGRRRVEVADFAALPRLADHKAVIFADAVMLIADRPKLVAILPAGEAKPGEIVASAAALLADQQTVAARAVQDFGVAHRLRVPPIKQQDGGPAGLRRGRLPDRRVVEVGALEDSTTGEDERAPFAEHIARAAELHRTVLALREVEPAARLLGLLVLAKVARPGAAEAIRTLRKSGRSTMIRKAEVAAQDRDALAGLALDNSAPGYPRPAIGIVRPGEAPLETTNATVHFGGRARVAPEPEAEIVVARDDLRALVDLLQFARDFRVRTRVAVAVSNLPGAALLAAALGYVPGSPLLVTGASLAGIALAVAMPQALRLSPAIANEVDEE